MEKGMKAGKKQWVTVTLARLLTAFSFGCVSYKTEQKQGRFVNQLLHQSVSSSVNTSSPAHACSLLPSPQKELIKYYVKIW